MGSSSSKPRRNSDSKYSDLQYHTPRGSIPTQMATHNVRHGPPPGAITKSRYPGVYRNSEGQDENKYPLYEPWEMRGVQKLVEHPVKVHGQPGFDPHKKTATKKQVDAYVYPKDRKRVVANPCNDPGAIRTVTNQGHQGVMGVNYHPPGNPRGYARAPLAPRDRQGRQQLEAHNRKLGKKSNTH